MNKQQLQTNVGYRVRFRPKAIDAAGVQRDDEWMIRKVDDEIVELVNQNSNHVLRMGYDSMVSFHRDPDRDSDGVKFGFLSLSVSVHLDGPAARIEPLPFARGGHAMSPQPVPTSVMPAVSAATAEAPWRELEERFDKMPGELMAIYEVYDSGLVTWSVHPEKPATSLDVDRFLADARAAGRLLAKYPYVKGKFDLNKFDDYADRWLSVVVELVNPRSQMHGSGVDVHGHHESSFVERVVNASRVACARLGSEVIPLSRDRIATTLLDLQRRCVHDVLNVQAPVDQGERGALQAEWLPLAKAWDADVIKTMRDIGCDHSEIQFVETFPLRDLRTTLFLYPMNSQWTISDMRRERLEKVIDGYLDKPIFTR